MNSSSPTKRNKSLSPLAKAFLSGAAALLFTNLRWAFTRIPRDTRPRTKQELLNAFIFYRESFGFFVAILRVIAYLFFNPLQVILLIARKAGSSYARNPPAPLSEPLLIPGAPTNWWLVVSALVTFSQSAHYSLSPPEDSHLHLTNLATRSLLTESSPKVSVVICYHSNFDELLACIESLLSFPVKNSFEIIVVDDTSTLHRIDWLNSISGIRVLRNPTNLGFLHSANRGMVEGQGDFLMLLNQDVVVCPGTMDELVGELELSQIPVIVGPRVLSTEYQVYEAGGQIFADGTTANRFRGYPANHPVLGFSRFVDYVSGCALALAKPLWLDLGGFSADFAPAYCEDVDLALRGLIHGVRTKYVSQAAVVHIEGTSMGTNENDPDQLKHHQSVNQKRIARTHGELLKFLPSRPDSFRDFWDSEIENEPFVLVFLSAPAGAAKDGGALDGWALIHQVQSLGYRVKLAYCRQKPSIQDVAFWGRKGVECTWLLDPRCHQLEERAMLIITMQLYAGLRIVNNERFTRWSCPWVHFTSDVYSRRLKAGELSEQLRGGRLATHLTESGIPLSSDEVFEKETQLFELTDLVLFVSQEDHNFIKEKTGKRIRSRIFPLIRNFRPQEIEPPKSVKNVAFVGSYTHDPNLDATRFLTEEIWPVVLDLVPEANLRLYGSGMSTELKSFFNARPSTEAIGWYSDFREVALWAEVTIAPLRYGAGVKGKVLESVAYGIPVIGTPVAFEGIFSKTALEWTGRTAKELGNAVASILSTPEVWMQTIIAQRAALFPKYSAVNEQLRVKEMLSHMLNRPDLLTE